MARGGEDRLNWPDWAAVAARWRRLRPEVEAAGAELLGPPDPNGPLDVRVEFRQFMVDHRGVPETGLTEWTLCQTIAVADSGSGGASAVVPAKDFAVVASDVHGGALRTTPLSELAHRARRVFADDRIDSDSRLAVERVSTRFRAALVPLHKHNSKWRTQVRYVVYDPMTESAERPRHAHIVSSVAGCALHTSRAAAVDGFTPLYSKLRRKESDESATAQRCYATDVSQLGAEELERSVATGPRGVCTDDASAWVISVPIVSAESHAAPGPNPSGGGGWAAPVPEEEDWYEQPDRRALRAAPAGSAGSAGDAVSRALREGRIGIGHHAADADSLLHGRLLTADRCAARLPEACGVRLYAVPCGNETPTREQLRAIAEDLRARAAEARAAALAARNALTTPGSPRNFPSKKARVCQQEHDLDVEMGG